MSLRIIPLLFLLFTEIRVISKAAMIMCVLSLLTVRVCITVIYFGNSVVYM